MRIAQVLFRTFCDLFSGVWRNGDEHGIAANMRGGIVSPAIHVQPAPHVAGLGRYVYFDGSDRVTVIQR